MKIKSEKHEIMAVLSNNQTLSFDLDSKQSFYHQKYEKFLESLILQKVSICEFIATC